MVSEAGSSEYADRVGFLASSLCAVHCVVAAFLPAAFGALGLGLLIGEEAEWGFTIVAIAFAFVALVLGWRRHKSPVVASVLALGVVGLMASRGLEMTSVHAHHGEHADGDTHADEPRKESGHADHVAADAHGGAGHEDGEGHDDEGHADLGHLAGTAVGVGAGLLLLCGHFLNTREARRCRDACAS